MSRVILLGFLALLTQNCQVNSTVKADDSSTPVEDARRLAAELVSAPAGSDERLPTFLTWDTRHDLDLRCGPNKKPALERLQRFPLKIDLDQGVHSMGPGADISKFEGSEAFYYDENASNRLCSPAFPASPNGAMSAAPDLFSGLVKSWQSSTNATFTVPRDIDGAFPVNSMAAVGIWQKLNRATVSKLSVKLRGEGGEVISREVSVLIPEDLFKKDLGCRPKTHEVVAKPEDFVDLNQFFWVQPAATDDRAGTEACGEIVVLVGFHLIKKMPPVSEPANVRGGHWLWSTFWWDIWNETKRARVPAGAKGDGGRAEAWNNYVIDATYRTDTITFNPWKSLELPNPSSPSCTGTNCAFCHRHAYFDGPATLSKGCGLLPDTPANKMRSDFIFAGPIQRQR